MPGFGWRSMGALHAKAVTTPAKITASNKYTAGTYALVYDNWPNTNVASPSYFATGHVAGTLTGTTLGASLTASQQHTAYQWLGYFKPNYTGTWTFTAINVDDTFILWIGSNAVSGFTTGNALLNIPSPNPATISLTSGVYYPFRAQYANNLGPGSLQFAYSHTGQSQTTNFNGLFFYNPATNGF